MLGIIDLVSWGWLITTTTPRTYSNTRTIGDEDDERRQQVRASLNRGAAQEAEGGEGGCIQGSFTPSNFHLHTLNSLFIHHSRCIILKQPKFLTKEQRAQLAIERRSKEIKEEKEREESKRREREALEREAGELERQNSQQQYHGGGHHGGYGGQQQGGGRYGGRCE